MEKNESDESKLREAEGSKKELEEVRKIILYNNYDVIIHR